METNELKLKAALALVIADKDFINDNSKVNKLLEVLTIKNGVTKQLNQAYTNGEKEWALAFSNGTATREGKSLAIKTHIVQTDAFKRFTTVPSTGTPAEVAKAEKARQDAMAWIADKFPVPEIDEVEQLENQEAA